MGADTENAAKMATLTTVEGQLPPNSVRSPPIRENRTFSRKSFQRKLWHVMEHLTHFSGPPAYLPKCDLMWTESGQ